MIVPYLDLRVDDLDLKKELISRVEKIYALMLDKMSSQTNIDDKIITNLKQDWAKKCGEPLD